MKIVYVNDDDDDDKYLFGPLTEVNLKRRPAIAKLLHTA